MDFQTDIDLMYIWMRKQGKNNKRLAKEIGCDESLPSLILTGRAKPSHEIARKIAQALGCGAVPYKIFPSLFTKNTIGEPTPRTTPIKEMPLSETELAWRVWRANEAAMTAEQCRIVAEGLGLSKFRLFPDRFDRLDNEIRPQPANPVPLRKDA